MTAALSSTLAMEQRRRRLVVVRFLRRAVPIAAGAALLAVTGQVVWRGIRLVMIPEAAAPEAAVRMVSPVFTGESRDGSRYRVSARAGARDAKDDVRIGLEAPTVTVTRPGGSATRATAQRGEFRQDDMTLQLDGNVQVTDDSGTRLTFRNAVFDTRTGRVVGKGVQSQGRDASVSSDQYAIDEKGGTMVFKGRVRGRINAP